jgi:starch synthase (maltosyl-transferring)
MMYQLAKVGFHTIVYLFHLGEIIKAELTNYLEELTTSEVKEFYRPNFWMNTPDILPYHLQTGKESTFIIRLFWQQP